MKNAFSVMPVPSVHFPPKFKPIDLPSDATGEGAFEGFGGCNTYSGSATASDDGTITMSGITSTEMACESDPITAQEIGYLTALENAVQYRASLTFLNGTIQTLRYALKGGD